MEFIYVRDPVKEVGFAGLNPYILYKICSRKFTDTEKVSLRRYNDFVWLAERLRIDHPDCVIPELPPKQSYGNFEPEFIERRRADLEIFLNKIFKHIVLSKSPHLLMFLLANDEVFAHAKLENSHSYIGSAFSTNSPVSSPIRNNDSKAISTNTPHSNTTTTTLLSKRAISEEEDALIDVLSPIKIGMLTPILQYKLISTRFTNRPTECVRKQQDFMWLRERLTHDYPDCIIPVLSITTSWFDDDHSIELQRKELEFFINKIAIHPKLSKCRHLNTFLIADEAMFEAARTHNYAGGGSDSSGSWLTDTINQLTGSPKVTRHNSPHSGSSKHFNNKRFPSSVPTDNNNEGEEDEDQRPSKRRSICSEFNNVLNIQTAPIRLINFEQFKKNGSFPRYPDCQYMCVDAKDIEKFDSFVVFISHSWIHSVKVAIESTDNNVLTKEEYIELPLQVSHPDTSTHEKYQLCVAGIEEIVASLAPDMKNCYIWLDYGCLNQDLPLPAEELDSLVDIMRVCDCLFTPILDENSNHAGIILHWLADYHAHDFNKGDYAYVNRKWCRLEMFYGSNVPFLKESSSLITSGLDKFSKVIHRYDKFRGPMKHYANLKLRPHLIYGTTENKLGKLPIVLDPLSNLLYEQYNPEKGFNSRIEDNDKITYFLSQLKPYLHSSKVGFEGERSFNPFGIGGKHGKGKEVFPGGDVYEGDFVNDYREGHGTYKYSNGNVYEGEWKKGENHGIGTMKYCNGNFYEGEWRENLRTGKGIYRWSNGNMYEGDFVNGLPHGKGLYMYAVDEPYEVEFMKPNGINVRRMFILPAGSVYEGEFSNGKRAGKGVMKYPDGTVYQGDWNCNIRWGKGKITFPDKTTQHGEWEFDTLRV